MQKHNDLDSSVTNKLPKKILFITSTFPHSDNDPVPAFVKDQIIWLHKKYPSIKIEVLAPHNSYSKTQQFLAHQAYNEYRFHYFWPFRWERLAGRGIQPALQQNKLLFLQIPFLIFFEFIATVRHVRRLKPDLMYAHWFTPQAITTYFASILTNTPFVFTTHASDVIILKRIPFAKNLVTRVCKKARAFTAVSQQTTDKLLSLVKEEAVKEIRSKLTIIPMGTIPAKVSREQIHKVKLSFELGQNFHILFIGRLVKRKGVLDLLAAFSAISKDIPSVRLIIAGDGQQKNQLEQKVKQLGITQQVTFTGYVSGNVKDSLLHIADIVCIPSINEGDQSEGLPVSFMEAVSLGKIVIASNVTGAQEYITPGKDGFIFPQKNVVALKTCMQEVLRLKKKDSILIKQHAKELSRRFHWQNITREHVAALFQD